MPQQPISFKVLQPMRLPITMVQISIVKTPQVSTTGVSSGLRDTETGNLIYPLQSG
jgi:hypothetical protein